MIKKIFKKLFLLGLLGIITIVGINIYIVQYSQEHIFSDVQKLSDKKIGIVLGARVYANGTVSDVLKDRLDGSIEAYNQKKIQNILVSGDNSVSDYNESDTMAAYLIKKGIPKEKIYRDYAGFDTYDTMYRARDIFGVKDAIIFTQEFHLNRSVYIARRLGIDSQGYISDKHIYLGIQRMKFRETLSRIKAFLNVEILKSKPKFLGETITIK